MQDQTPFSKIVSIFFMLTVAVAILIGVKIWSAPTRTVTVVGVGSQKTSSDKAVITFAFSSSSSTKESATSQGEQEFAELLAVVDNFSPIDVKRVSYQVQPALTRTNEVTYQYVSGASVTLQGVDSIANLLRTLSQDNIQVASIRYLPENEQQANQEAQNLALQNAKEKAEQIATSSNARIGKVLSVVEQGSNAQTGSSVTNLQATADELNQVNIDSAVTVTFELR